VSDVQHVVVLIDCRAEMFQEYLPDPNFPDDPEAKICPVDYALGICDQLLRQKIKTVTIHKTGKRDGFGIVLYNTQYSKTPKILAEWRDRIIEANSKKIPTDIDENDDDEHTNLEEKATPGNVDDDDDDDDMDTGYYTRASSVHVLLPLYPPGRQSVQLVKDCRSSDPFSDPIIDLKENFAKNKETDQFDLVPTHPLQTVLYDVAQIFRQAPCVKKQRYGPVIDSTRGIRKNVPPDGRSVWIFTNDDQMSMEGSNPNTQQELHNILRTQIDDIRETGIELVIWPLPESPATFSYEFYDSFGFLCPARDIELDEIKDLVNQMSMQWKRTRRLFCGPLLLPGQIPYGDKSSSQLAPPPGIMLDFFSLVQIATPPTKVPIHQQTGRYVSELVCV
jgi:hypothetical protein